MKCYFDGSQGNDDSAHTWVTLAGYGAPDAIWADFENKWFTMLRDRYPIAPYIHMHELTGWDDPFERVVGWNEDNKTQLVLDAVSLLGKVDQSKICSFLCTIDLTAHERLTGLGHPISDPYVICADLCIGNSVAWYNDKHPAKPELAHIFFDRDEQFMHDFKRRWLLGKTRPNKVSVHPTWDIIKNITDEDMRDHPGLQAADMVAWGRSRQLSERDRPYKYLLEIIRKVVPSWTWILDEDVLKNKNPIPARN
jgi:hypothetical protein